MSYQIMVGTSQHIRYNNLHNTRENVYMCIIYFIHITYIKLGYQVNRIHVKCQQDHRNA